MMCGCLTWRSTRKGAMGVAFEMSPTPEVSTTARHTRMFLGIQVCI